MRQLVITKQITQRDIRSVELYLNEVSKYKMVTAEEEVELAGRIKNGDKEALQRLVEANLRFVISVAKQYQNKGLSFADLINEGNLGLVKAAGKFDETRGFKFISYAVWWIRQSIIVALSEQTRTIRLPLNRLSVMTKVANASRELEQKYEREPTDIEIADFLELNEQMIKENQQLKEKILSFDLPLSKDGSNDFSLADVVQSDYFAPPDNKLLGESAMVNISRALKKLGPREAEIITYSFGLNNQVILNMDEMASRFNISGERIRQIKAQSLEKLRILLGESESFND